LLIVHSPNYKFDLLTGHYHSFIMSKVLENAASQSGMRHVTGISKQHYIPNVVYSWGFCAPNYGTVMLLRLNHL